jgi:branched-chain amino acid transport system permease protein
MAVASEASPVTAGRPPFDLMAALKDAAFSALIAFGLFSLLVGLETRQTLTNEIVLVPRPGMLAILVAIVFFGRLAMHLYKAARGPVVAKARKPSKLVAKLEANSGPIFLGFALIAPILLVQATGGLQPSRYWIDLGVLLLTYIMLGWGLNIVVGLAGLLDLGYVAFYAIGAYSYALISTSLMRLPELSFLVPWIFWICLPIAGLLAALWGMILGFPVLRLRGDYLAIVTLAFGEIIRLVLLNWEQVTNGGAGISSIPRPTFFGLPFTAGDNGFAAYFGLQFDPAHRLVFFYYLILVLAAVTYVATLRLRRLPVGRAWEALREDEIACRSLGINTVNTKLTAFAIGAAFGGIAGCFFATRQGFVSPESFTFHESAIILAIVVLGGMGSMLGVIIATLVLIGGPELLRHVEFLKHIFGRDFDPTQYRMLLLGLGMVLIMIWRPRGLISTREPTAYLKEKKLVSSDLVKEGHG